MDFSRDPAGFAHARGGADDLSEREGSRTWSRRWRSASSPTATTICISPCSPTSATPAQTLPGDEALLRLAAQGHRELNAKHAHAGAFFLFHRPRRWNPARRRVDGLRAQARQAGRPQRAAARRRAATASRCVVGDIAALAGGALRDHARHRHAAAARRGARSSSAPWRTRSTGRATTPARTARASRATASCSRASRVSLPSSEPLALRAAVRRRRRASIPYTRAVSDVYQDLFGEGSFIGKGIYDVDAFERALTARFPDNRILSHDLLEGCYARSGLLSDVSCSRTIRRATAPTSARRHRWIRGDWQIARVAAAARADRDGRRGVATRCRRCRAGRSSTTCAAAWCRRR